MDSVRFCVLWIPTQLHGLIFPLDSDSTQSSNVVYHKHGVVDYPNDDIKKTGIVCSDDAETKVTIDITLLKEGYNPPEFELFPYKRHYPNGIPLRHILIEAKKNSGEVFDTLFLQCIDARQNGLMQYCYKVPQKYFDPNGHGKYLLNSHLNITNAIYHNIKSFYHVHEYHDAAKDSILHPYSSDTITYLSQSDNPALLHYLEEFSDVLTDELPFIKEIKATHFKRYRRLSNILFKYRESLNREAHRKLHLYLLTLKLHYINTLLVKCIDQCRKALHMSVYYKSLLCSRYNGSCKASAYNESGNNQLYKKAINVQNTIETIRLEHKEMADFVATELSTLNQCYLKVLGRQTKAIQELTDKASKQSFVWTITTCIISIICSVIVSALFYYLSKPDYTPQQDIQRIIELQKRTDSILNAQQSQLKEMESTNQKIRDYMKPKSGRKK